MPKTKQTLMLTYWRRSESGDHNELPAIQALNRAGVRDARFFSAKQEAMVMECMADPNDPAQIEAAIEYAKANLFLRVDRCFVHDLQVWVNARQYSHEIQKTHENA